MTDQMLKPNSYLRRIKSEDVDVCFERIGNREVRQCVSDSRNSAYDDYDALYGQKAHNRNQIQYMMMIDDVLAGYIRYIINENYAELDYIILNDVGGFGYESELIGLAVKQIREDYPKIKKLISKVNLSNVAAYYSFTKNGFVEKHQHLEIDLDRENESGMEEVSSNKSGSFDRDGLRVLFLTNNRNAIELFEWISKRCSAEIVSGRLSIDYLSGMSPDLVISYNYIYLVSKGCIDAVSGNIINMHISYLPWNRGFSPNIWSFIDDTPKGVTIHMLSEGLDEGDILYQKEMYFDPRRETFQSTYQVLNETIVGLLKTNWDGIISRDYKSFARRQCGSGSYHSISDLKKLRELHPFEWTDNIEGFLQRYYPKSI